MELLEKTSNGILFDSSLQGPYGVRIELYPNKANHNQEHIKSAKHELRISRDVTGFKITWEDDSFYKENDY